MKALFCITVIFLTSICKLQAQVNTSTWIYVIDDVDQNQYYIQSNCVKSSYGEIKVWVKTKEKKLKVNGKIYINGTVKTLYNFDCKNKKQCWTTQAYYSSTDKLIDSEETIIQKWEDTIPESIGEYLLNKACELFNKK